MWLPWEPEALQARDGEGETGGSAGAGGCGWGQLEEYAAPACRLLACGLNLWLSRQGQRMCLDTGALSSREAIHLTL